MTEKVIAVFVDYVDHFTETYMTEVEIWEEAIIEIKVGTRECAFQFIK